MWMLWGRGEEKLETKGGKRPTQIKTNANFDYSGVKLFEKMIRVILISAAPFSPASMFP